MEKGKEVEVCLKAREIWIIHSKNLARSIFPTPSGAKT